MKPLNLTGKRYGKLTVLQKANSVRTRTGAYTMWRCHCDCGAKTVVRTSHLTEGRTKSCGCLFLQSLTDKPRGRKPTGTAYLRYVFGYYLKNAASRKLPFEIDFDRFCSLVTRNCHYCGSPPCQGKNKARLDRPVVFNGIIKHNGLDRVNNEEGYTQANTVPCCKHCNRAKRDRTVAEFKQWAMQLYYHWAAAADNAITA